MSHRILFECWTVPLRSQNFWYVELWHREGCFIFWTVSNALKKSCLLYTSSWSVFLAYNLCACWWLFTWLRFVSLGCFEDLLRAIFQPYRDLEARVRTPVAYSASRYTTAASSVVSLGCFEDLVRAIFQPYRDLEAPVRTPVAYSASRYTTAASSVVSATETK